MLFFKIYIIIALALCAEAIAKKKPFSTSATAASPASPTSSDYADVMAARATANTSSPVSYVEGKAFNRFVNIWFENTDYDTALADPNFKCFAELGVTLDSYFAVTHPSQPNYLAAVAGKFDFTSHDIAAVTYLYTVIISASIVIHSSRFLTMSRQLSTSSRTKESPGDCTRRICRTLATKGLNGETRKTLIVIEINSQHTNTHPLSPEILFNSVVTKPERLELIKNTTMFHADVAANTLPQWMFITPNMTSDAHDSSITVAGEWLRDFLGPYLKDENFMNNTLVLITFDENETYAAKNRILSILLGDAVPEDLVNTTDSTYYDHYSEIASVVANWDLHTLGRFDVGANVFKYIAEKTGDRIRSWSNGTLESRFFNYSYPWYSRSEGWMGSAAPSKHQVDYPGHQ
ncbi:hypothetical protein EYC84_011342 [Monilinia fructicola]|uniref:Acid phosphatase n=1 Tax=Monilinia fructicola TaxID=38448 RepID=A0A5M9J961_MONFR|nr:hypothetical protein EYC84_011342 [Monilinia fructicola]